MIMLDIVRPVSPPLTKGSSCCLWRGSGGGQLAIEASSLESPWLLAQLEDAKDEEQDINCQQTLLAGPPLADNVKGDCDLRK
jgi:hypothetical protein